MQKRRSRGVVRVEATQHARHPGERGDHQAVPRRENLVIAMRSRPREPGLEHLQPRAVENIHDFVGRLPRLARQVLDRPRDIQNVLAGELLLGVLRRVPAGLDPEPAADDGRVAAR